MIKQSQSPYGYKNLLVFKKAEELQLSCTKLTGVFPKTKTLIALADQMNRSARSVKQNIVEGWKRNSTKEYYEFLGFSIGANAELEEDCMDVWKGVYPELKGIKGVMGERGIPSTPLTSSSHSTPSKSPSPSSNSIRSTFVSPSAPSTISSPSALSSYSAHTPFSSPSAPLS